MFVVCPHKYWTSSIREFSEFKISAGIIDLCFLSKDIGWNVTYLMKFFIPDFEELFLKLLVFCCILFTFRSIEE